MTSNTWRARAGSVFACEKQPAISHRGMVVTNHALASAAGIRILAEGGNAIDAAIASLFALTVVEPMMVGILGGGMAHIRLADGRHLVLDGQSTVAAAATPDMYRPLTDASDRLVANYMEVEDRANTVGARAVAVPGALPGWCEALRRFGTFPLADVVAPAIDLAERGFRTTPYLTECVTQAQADLATDPDLARWFLPDGAPLRPGSRLQRPEYAETLRLVARDGEAALRDGPIATEFVAAMAARGGLITAADLRAVRTIERAPIGTTYRGFEVFGPPPPAASGVHVAEMLNVLEGFDLAGLGYGSAETMHLVAEALKIAFADRAAASGDPDFIDVPVARLTSKEYAAARRAELDPGQARRWSAGVPAATESANTTHLTVADQAGNVVATTQTINSLFGARFSIPGTGLIPNNYMNNYDPHPGFALSVAPGKRVTTSMSPLIVLRDGRVRFALGLPGGVRIFTSAMQAVLNLLDHGMSVQEAVEAPRIWSQGGAVEIEPGFTEAALQGLRDRGQELLPVMTVGGGMNAIAFGEDGTMTGAACWRADGTPIGLGGGLSRRGTRFHPDAVRRG
jgi:gamma-glutamyltranspeptidase/glutathione hydrolase